MVSAVSIGPDGIYFSPILGIDGGDSLVYRISFRPEKELPYRPYDISNLKVKLHSKTCLSCHSLDGQGGKEAPSLDKEELVTRFNVRLNSPEYLAQIAAADLLAGRPFVDSAKERNMIRRSSGYERISLWVISHLMEPKFDNPDAVMPNLNLTHKEAKLLAEYLLGKEGEVYINIFEVREDSSYSQAGGLTQGRLGKITLRDANTIHSLLIGFLLGAASAAGVTAWRNFRNRY